MPYAAIAAIIGAASSIYGASASSKAAKKAASAGLKMTDDQTRMLRTAQGTNMAQLNEILDRSVGEMQGEAVASNLASFKGIDKLMGRFSTSHLKRTEQAIDPFMRLLATVAGSNGVSVTDLIGSMAAGGYRTTADADYLSARGRSLIDGRFYDTPVGRQSSEELVRRMAPGLSSAGLDQIQRTLAGASSAGEVDSITGFLRDADEKARYGDTLLDNSARVREMGLGRLGAVLAEVNAQADFVASNAQSVASQGTAIGAGQLVNAGTVMGWEQTRANGIAEIIRMNMNAALGVGSAAGGMYSAGVQGQLAAGQGYANAGQMLGNLAAYYGDRSRGPTGGGGTGGGTGAVYTGTKSVPTGGVNTVKPTAK